MKKEETKELEELSLKVFGRKYAYRKLRTKGLALEQSINKGTGNLGRVVRRMPLSPQGVKMYMEKTLAMREEIKKQQETQKDENRG